MAAGTTHRLTQWDCDILYQPINPIIAWAVEGNLDIDGLAEALRRAIAAEAAWVGGRLVLRPNQHPRYGIRVPSPEEKVPPFEVTRFEGGHRDLQTLLPDYVPTGEAKPRVSRCDATKLECLAGLAPFLIKADEAAKRAKPLLHLHFVRARDASLICLAWRHVVMDATGLSQVVAAWERAISGVGTGPSRERPTLDDFNEKIELKEADAMLPGWTLLTPLSLMYLLARAKLLDRTLLGYPATVGTVYIPPTIVGKWVAEVRAEVGDGVRISRNDIVAAWYHKTAWGVYTAGTETTLTRAVNLRGRHESAPQEASGNVLALAVCPPRHAEGLAKASLAELALETRQSVHKCLEPDQIAAFARFVNYRARTNKFAVPGTTPYNRLCLLSSYANLGLTNPNFGKDVEVRAALQLTSDFMAHRIIDDKDGGWRVHGKLPYAAWGAIEAALEEEMRQLRGG